MKTETLNTEIKKDSKLVIKPLIERKPGKFIPKTMNQNLASSPDSGSGSGSVETGFDWINALKGSTGDVVSTITSGSYVYAGANGIVYQYSLDGTLMGTNAMPGAGSQEVRLAITSKYLVAGTNGYVVLVDLSNFSNTDNNIFVSLPGCGNSVTSVITNGSNIFAGSNGYVYQLSLSGSIIASNNLPGRGNQEVRLAVTASNLVVGTSGFVVLVNLSKFSTTASNVNLNLPSCGYNPVSVVCNSSYIYAGSNGYVYQMDLSGGNMTQNNLKGLGHQDVGLTIGANYLYVGTNGYVVSLKPSDMSIYTTINLSNAGGNGIVNVVFDSASGNVFAGANGYVYAITESSSVTNSQNNGLQNISATDEIRLSVSNEQVYVGCDGYLASPTM